MNKEEYFDDDYVIKNELYESFHDLIICPICKKIFKNPLMCPECMESFCEKCIEDKLRCKKCKKKIQYKESITKNQLLSGLSYKCKNCLKDINKNEINAHLESNCIHKEEEKKTLKEMFTTKKKLKRISEEEMEIRLKNNEKIYIFKSSNLIII